MVAALARHPGSPEGRSHHRLLRESGQCRRVSRLDYTENYNIAARGELPGTRRGVANLETACARIRSDLIGRLSPIETPFGKKPLVCEHYNAVSRAPSVINISNMAA